MKDPWEWDESDILSLIENRVPESNNLEFKACDALTNARWRPELVKDVSAFANAAGGTIIYGIKESQETHEAESIDEGYDPAVHKKERLEQIIDSSIQRRIEGVRYNAVRLDKTQPGKILFVIYVPQSERSPHMANHVFYKRLEFESKAMEEYEVRERYGRVTFPGKDVVEAWRDDAINPLIQGLETEEVRLRDELWSWNRLTKRFEGLIRMGARAGVSPNLEDFIDRHSEVGLMLHEHDNHLATVNSKGQELFEKIAGSSYIRDVFNWTCSEEALMALKNENPNRFKGETRTEIFNDLFSPSTSTDEWIDLFAEWSINGRAAPTTMDSIMLFWRANKDRFRDLVIYPPLSGNRQIVCQAREKLLEINQSLVAALKRIRKELSERHNVAFAPTLQTAVDPWHY